MCDWFYVLIYEGTVIAMDFIEDYCRIGAEVKIGEKCRIMYAANISSETTLGDDCIIAGFCCERAIVGNKVRLFGELIHSHREPNRDWDEVEEDSPKISDNVLIGFGAKVIGGISIGKNSYIAAGAIVTRNVPEAHVVTGINKKVHFRKWKEDSELHLFLESR